MEHESRPSAASVTDVAEDPRSESGMQSTPTLVPIDDITVVEGLHP